MYEYVLIQGSATMAVGSIQPATACSSMTWVRMIIPFLKREDYSEEESLIKPKIFTVCPLWKWADPCCRL